MLIKMTYPTDCIEKTTSEIEDPTLSEAEVEETGRGTQDGLGKRNDVNASFLKGESVKR